MRSFFICWLFLFNVFFCYAQQEYTSEELFNEGQYFFQRQDYKEAVFFFKQLAEKVPANNNYNFKVGECYLNIPGQEQLAIPYLEKASKKVVPKKEYDSRNFNERSAPLHALFYLGNAYRMAGQLSDALASYNKFLDSPYFYGSYNQNVVEAEIALCERAKIIQDAPIKFTKTLLADSINTSYSEFTPVLSADGQTFLFVRGLKFYDAVFMSKKTADGWSEPYSINPDILSDGDMYPTGINSNGTVLLLVKETDENADIYISYLKDSKWTKAEEIPGKINSLSAESFASFGPDDRTIYFSSDRSGSKGGKDIFYSIQKDDGSWDKPKNIGKVINSEVDEDAPVICNDGKTIFFSSKSHYNMGGYDIFYSNFINKKWSEPKNIGFPINTTRDDVFYIVDNTCKTALYSIINLETGLADIYEIELTKPLAIP
jgi:tetratricopeptide (TPR) repeat protein